MILEEKRISRRELIRHRGGQLRFDSLLQDEKGGEKQQVIEGKVGGPINLDEAMAAHISNILKMTKGKIHGPGGAAEILGINPNTLRGRMSKLGLKYSRRT